MTTGPRQAGCPVRVMPVDDLVAPGLYGTGDPHRIWRRMRRGSPVSWQPVDDGGFWSVTRYHDVERVLRDHGTFTSERGSLLNLLGRDDPAGGRQMAVTDPPRHTRMRAPLQRALSIRNAENDADRIRRIVRGLLAPLRQGEPFDFAAAMAALPMAVIGSTMDLPEPDWPRLTTLTSAAIAPDDPEFRGPHGADATLAAAHRELFAYFQDIVADRRGHPGDDLISLLLTMELDGARLAPGEIVSNCYSLLLGANVTTAQPPTAAVLELAGTDRFGKWAADPGLLSTGVEEALRWSSPAQHFMRYAVSDVDLGDVTVRAGDAVVAWLASANRDEEVFAEPDTFKVGRRPNKHVAFGVGPHYCIGHTVARVTLRVLFAELLAGFTGIELAGEPDRLHSNFVAGIKHLMVTAEPRVPGR
jgi:cytochrome P450